MQQQPAAACPAQESGPDTDRHRDGTHAQDVPRLSRPGYATQPSLQQLAALAAQDPALLASVSNFVVAREDKGQVRWLQPVDVRGLDLDSIITVDTGVVEVRCLPCSPGLDPWVCCRASCASRPALPCPALPCPALPCPALPCPARDVPACMRCTAGGRQTLCGRVRQRLPARARWALTTPCLCGPQRPGVRQLRGGVKLVSTACCPACCMLLCCRHGRCGLQARSAGTPGMGGAADVQAAAARQAGSRLAVQQAGTALPVRRCTRAGTSRTWARG